MSMPDKDKLASTLAILAVSGMPTAPVINDEKSLSVSAKDKDSSLSLQSKDEIDTSYYAFKDDKNSSLSTSLPSKDDKFPSSLASTSHEADESSSSSIFEVEKTSSLEDKHKSFAASLPAKDSKTSGLQSTQGSILTSLRRKDDKATNLSGKAKTAGQPEIVYSVTVLAAPASGKSSVQPSSLPTSSLNSTVTHSRSRAMYLTSPSLTVISLRSVSSSEFPGYQIVPSPTQLPLKDVQHGTASVIPVYTPTMLGNAYGGGFIPTPSIYVSRLPFPNGPSEGIPPGYGSYSKPEIIPKSFNQLPSVVVERNKTFILNVSILIESSKDESSKFVK